MPILMSICVRSGSDPRSYVPLYFQTNPTINPALDGTDITPQQQGLSIGHEQSKYRLEVRMCDGTCVHVCGRLDSHKPRA